MAKLKLPDDPISEARPTGKPPKPGLAAFRAGRRYSAAVVAAEGRLDQASARTYTRSPANWKGYSDAK